MLNNQVNQINQMLQFISGGGNKEQFIEMFAQKNPQFAQAYNFMKNQATSNKISMQDVAMNIAKQNGIDPKYLTQVAEKMGHK